MANDDELPDNVASLIDYRVKKGLKCKREQVCHHCGKRFDHWWTSSLFFCVNKGEKHIPTGPVKGDIFA